MAGERPGTIRHLLRCLETAAKVDSWGDEDWEEALRGGREQAARTSGKLRSAWDGYVKLLSMVRT